MSAIFNLQQISVDNTIYLLEGLSDDERVKYGHVVFYSILNPFYDKLIKELNDDLDDYGD